MRSTWGLASQRCFPLSHASRTSGASPPARQGHGSTYPKRAIVRRAEDFGLVRRGDDGQGIHRPHVPGQRAHLLLRLDIPDLSEENRRETAQRDEAPQPAEKGAEQEKARPASGITGTGTALRDGNSIL